MKWWFGLNWIMSCIISIAAQVAHSLGDLGAQSCSLLDGGGDISGDGWEQGARHTHRAWTWRAICLMANECDTKHLGKKWNMNGVWYTKDMYFVILYSCLIPPIMCVILCIVSSWFSLGFWDFSSPYGSDSFKPLAMRTWTETCA